MFCLLLNQWVQNLTCTNGLLYKRMMSLNWGLKITEGWFQLFWQLQSLDDQMWDDVSARAPIAPDLNLARVVRRRYHADVGRPIAPSCRVASKPLLVRIGQYRHGDWQGNMTGATRREFNPNQESRATWTWNWRVIGLFVNQVNFGLGGRNVARALLLVEIFEQFIAKTKLFQFLTGCLISLPYLIEYLEHWIQLIIWQARFLGLYKNKISTTTEWSHLPFPAWHGRPLLWFECHETGPISVFGHTFSG